MLLPLLDALTEAAHSQIFAGGAALGAMGVLVAALRNTPKQLWGLFLRTATISIDVESKELAFEWLREWLNEQPYSQRSRRLSVSVVRTWDEGKADHQVRVIFTPAPGNHWFWYKGKLVWLSRDREKGGEKKDDSPSMLPIRETLYVRMFGRNQKIVRALLAEAQALYMVYEKRPNLYVNNTQYWNCIGPVPPRTLASIVMPVGQSQRLLADAQQFLASAQWYHERNIPYRRGYLFWGPPGTGKSSTLTALAHELGKPLCVCNVGSPQMTDDRLFSLVADAPHGAIMVFEDIDAAVRSREGKRTKTDQDNKPLTLSALLNAIDGVAAREGVLTVLTTNYLERLDPALIRPGRVDEQFEFGFANAYQARQLFERFYGPATPGAAQFASGVKDCRVSPADIQRLLMNNRTDPANAVKEFTHPT